MIIESETLNYWIEKYERKTGEQFKVPKGFRLFFLPARGFAQFKVDQQGKMLVVYQLCGDANFWRDLGEIICWQNDLRYISTICTRSIKPYIRLFGWSIISEFEKNSQKRFICKDKQDRKIIITHKGKDTDEKLPTYWVTHYLRERV